MRKLVCFFFFFALPFLCSADILTVDDNGPADFNTIQSAINASTDGDTIIVNPGIYRGNGNRDIDFLGKAITLRSTDPNVPDIIASTIIDCNGTQQEPHRGFYFHLSEDSNSVLDGLTISNGCGPIEQIINGPYNSLGGAIFCIQSSPTISRCVIANCSASYGGGIFCKDSNLTLNGTSFQKNSAISGGGMFNSGGGNPLLIECSFLKNHLLDYGDGSGLCNVNSNANYINCDFIGNWGGSGGAVSIALSEPVFKNCRFIRNFATIVVICPYGGGAVSCGSSNPLFLNCLFSANSSAAGGAVSNYESSPVFKNCTFTSNIEPCIYNWWADNHPVIINSILWDQGTEEIYLSGNSTITVNYCDIKGGWPGIGNINVDPCFVDPGHWDPNGTPADANDDFWVNGDYHLKSQAGRWDPNTHSWVLDNVTSPCIDAGDWMTPIGLEPFPNGGRVNMGAYGGTEQASKSYFGKPPCQTIIAGDINGDCIVDLKDFSIMALHWLEER